MLLPDNIHPEQTVYYNGSIVLKVLLTRDEKRASLLDLYQEVKDFEDITLPMFVLCLDWLYLVDVAQLNEEGEVKLCISSN